MLIVEFHDLTRNRSYDLQLPEFLTGEELVVALTKAYDLPINVHDINQLYMRTENPIALIAGKKTLKEIGISNNTKIYMDPR